MRTIKHLTPRYLFNRLSEIRYQKMNPDKPWLTRRANELLEDLLIDKSLGLEFGSGRSTIWLAKRIKFLTSVEHKRQWYDIVNQGLKEQGIESVKLLLCESDAGTDDPGEKTEYVGVIDSFKDESLDFALVDGIYRADCANKVVSKIRPGGVLVVDNVNWFLPNNETTSPNSRKTSQGPASVVWQRFSEATQDWQQIWTTSGVTDTAIYIKPLV